MIDCDNLRPPSGVIRHLVLQLIIAAAWLSVWNAARLLEFAPHASLWFPPAGMTFAVLRVLGWRGLPGILIAAMAATFQTDALYDQAGGPLSTALAGMFFFGAHCLAYGLGVFGFLRLAGPANPRPSPRSVVAFLAVTPVAALLAAAGGITGLVLAGKLASADGLSVLFPWWLGDFAGLVALAPLFTIALERVLERLKMPTAGVLDEYRRVAPADPRRGPFLAKLGFAVLIASAAGAVVTVGFSDLGANAFFFVIVPLTWIVHTEGAIRSCVAVAALSTLIAAVSKFAPIGELSMTYQFVVIIISGSAYFGLSVPGLYADNERLRRLLMVDSLTGAASRLFFFDAARREIDRAARVAEPVSLIFFDLDHFKEVNDRFGHAFGDALLRCVAQRCLGVVRAGEALGRIGGEEFAAVLPGADLEGALVLAERLRLVIADEEIDCVRGSWPMTASFGVVEVKPGEESIEEAMERADRALYEAKSGGRNQVRVA